MKHQRAIVIAGGVAHVEVAMRITVTGMPGVLRSDATRTSVREAMQVSLGLDHDADIEIDFCEDLMSVEHLCILVRGEMLEKNAVYVAGVIAKTIWPLYQAHACLKPQGYRVSTKVH